MLGLSFWSERYCTHHGTISHFLKIMSTLVQHKENNYKKRKGEKMLWLLSIVPNVAKKSATKHQLAFTAASLLLWTSFPYLPRKILLQEPCCVQKQEKYTGKSVLFDTGHISGGKILPQRCAPLPAKIPVFSSSSQLKRLRHLIRCRPHLFWVWSDIKVQRGTGVGVA